LFEEKWDTGGAALIANGNHPLFFHGTSPWATLTPHDDPMDAGKIKLAEVFEQRLDGKKANCSGCGLQMLDAWQAVLAVFNADAPPNVIRAR
jgi:hypothetical protein